MYLIFHSRKYVWRILALLTPREQPQQMSVEWMNSSPVKSTSRCQKNHSQMLLSLLHFLFSKLQRPHFTQSPHLSFMVLCDLASTLIFKLYHLLTASLGLPPTVLDVRLLRDSWKEVQAKSCHFLTCSHLLIPPASRELVHKLPTRDLCNPMVSGLRPLLWSCAGGASTSQLALILLLCCNVSCARGYGCAYVFSCSQIWQMLWDDLKIFWIPDRAWHSVMHIECYELNCVSAKSLCWSPNIKHLKHDHVWK